MLKRRGSILTLTAIFLGLMAAVAPAHTKSFPTTFTSLTVQEGSRSTLVLISGTLDSPNNACAKNRTVRAGFFDPNSGLTSGIQTTKSKGNAGAFSVEVIRKSSTFKVQVEKSNLPGKRKHKHKCGRVTRDVSGP
jgi:hypothetical protein